MGLNVLIIEDTDSIRKMIEALMSARGHKVTGASNGARGLECALEETPDLVLLDLNLPGAFDGIEVCRRLRAEEATSHVPILIISAMNDDDTRARVLDAGATAFYSKPFSPMSLLKEIDSIKIRLSSSPKLPTT
jgi:two-component system cell cycle response regulator